jgi:hypothetical protein
MTRAATQDAPADTSEVVGYGLADESEAATIFPDKPALHRRWGVLFVTASVDGEPFTFTLLGKPSWIESLEGQQRPLAPDDPEAEETGAIHSGEVADFSRLSVASEWGLDLFEPEWLAAGWPKDWDWDEGEEVPVFPVAWFRDDSQ